MLRGFGATANTAHVPFASEAAGPSRDLFPENAIEPAMRAAEAKDSRLYGGIHTGLDDEAGAALGRLVGSLVVARAARDGAP